MTFFRAAFAEAERELAIGLNTRTVNTCKRLLEAFGPTLRCRDCYHPDYRALLSHRIFFKKPEGAVTGTWDTPHEINFDKVVEFADQQASDLIDGFVAKLNEKLGDLDAAVVRRASSRGAFTISGQKNDHAVTVEQQVVIKVSKHGLWYAQFPARIYVDGKFTPASKYEAAIA
jgi:hypothetical protein